MMCWSFKRLLYHEQGTGRMTADADRVRLIEAIDPARCAGDLCRDGQREDRRRRDRINLLVDLVKLKCVPKNVENWLDPTDGEQPQMRSEIL